MQCMECIRYSNTHKNFHTIPWKCNLYYLRLYFFFFFCSNRKSYKKIQTGNKQNANKANGNQATII